jgi:hypothetical protein
VGILARYSSDVVKGSFVPFAVRFG